MFSKDLEVSIANLFDKAQEINIQYLTVEHLFLIILNDYDVKDFIEGQNVSVDALKDDLNEHLKKSSIMRTDNQKAVQPTLGFQRVLQRAVFHIQSSGKGVVKPINILVAIFSEKESRSVYILNKNNINRLDVVTFISHGPLEKKTTDSSTANEENIQAENIKSEESPYLINLNNSVNEDNIQSILLQYAKAQKPSQQSYQSLQTQSNKSTNEEDDEFSEEVLFSSIEEDATNESITTPPSTINETITKEQFQTSDNSATQLYQNISDVEKTFFTDILKSTESGGVESTFKEFHNEAEELIMKDDSEDDYEDSVAEDDSEDDAEDSVAEDDSDEELEESVAAEDDSDEELEESVAAEDDSDEELEESVAAEDDSDEELEESVAEDDSDEELEESVADSLSSVDLDMLKNNEFTEQNTDTIQTVVDMNTMTDNEPVSVQVATINDTDSEEDELDVSEYEHIENEEYCKFDIDQTICKNVLSNYLQSDASEYVTFIRKKTCKELRTLLKQCQISTVGKKQELINKLIVIRQKIN